MNMGIIAFHRVFFENEESISDCSNGIENDERKRYDNGSDFCSSYDREICKSKS